MNPTREQIEAERAEQRAKNLKMALEDAERLQTAIVTALRSRLASVYTVYAVTDTHQNGDVRRRVEVTEVDSKQQWAIRIGAHFAGRYSFSTAYEVRALGDSYTRERRSYQPEYKLTQQGWNYERMAADAVRAITSKIEQRKLEERRASNYARSAETFAEVLKCTGDKPAYEGASYANISLPKFTVEVTAGDYWDGTVRLKVTLNKIGLNAAQAVELIEQLRKVQ
jgi:hypothetical protein